MTQTKILIVEDDRVVARDIHEHLLQLGYSVVGVTAFGAEAVRMAMTLRPDVVLMDIYLEGETDGIDAAQKIRVDCQLPVIYLTAFADEEILRRARITEPFGYLLKPFDDRELHTVLEMALYKHQADRRLSESHEQIRKAAEAQRLAEEKYRNIFDNAVDGIFQSTSQGRFITVNPALALMLGYSSPEELISSIENIAQQLYVEPERRAEYLQLLQEMGVVKAFECQFFRKDGSKIWISVSTRAVRNADSSECYYEGIVEDITERKRLEEQFHQSQKMEAIGQLAGGVAHDFNNLLTVIAGYSNLLLNELHLKDPLRAPIDEIRRASDRAAVLTRQLLAFSRKQLVTPQVLDLNALVSEMEKMLRRLIGENIDLMTILDPHLGRVKADTGQMEQVVMNLVVNARDAMPRGGCVAIETTNVELTDEAEKEHPDARPGHYVRITVSDTGCGISPEIQRRIFEPFFTTKDRGKGTGLGLATVYGIVKHSDGFITIESAMERGTSFHIFLPRTKDPLDAKCAHANNGVHRARGETILLVEDEDQVRKLIFLQLETAGYTVLQAKNGMKASEVSKHYSGVIHLLLTDVVMPGMGGRELAERLLAQRPTMKVIYLSGYGDDPVRVNAEIGPSTARMAKPFVAEALLRLVRELLDLDSAKCFK